MSYCLAIRVEAGILFASDSRTNAGVDQVSTYRKMHIVNDPGRRTFVLLCAGNLATTQAVVHRIERDLADGGDSASLRSVEHLADAAEYVGGVSRAAQSLGGAEQSSVNLEATFILGGQIGARAPEIFLIYAEGNYIRASSTNPYLQIGEIKYGKPILDRIVEPSLSLEDVARCALVSMDSTQRSNISVGPPFELAFYRAGSLAIERHLSLTMDSPLYAAITTSWNQSLRSGFASLPRFEWER